MRLNHILFKTNDIEAMVNFLVDVVGLEEGYRPPFRSPGAWVYSGGVALFHLVETARGQQSTGNIDHVAIEGGDYTALVARLTQHSLPFEEALVPETGLRQVFIAAPDGLSIEMLFDA